MDVPRCASLLAYFGGKGKPFKFAPPQHLKNSQYVRAELAYHRAVYLIEKKARLGAVTMIGGYKVDQKEAWVGTTPRLQKGKWGGKSRLEEEASVVGWDFEVRGPGTGEASRVRCRHENAD